MQRRGKFFAFDDMKSPTYVVVVSFKDRHEGEERHSYIREQCRRGNWSAIYSCLHGGAISMTASQAERSLRNKVLRRTKADILIDLALNLAPGVYDVYAFEDADDAVFFKLRFA